MWKIVAIIVLAIPFALALETIRVEVRRMRAEKGKIVKPENEDDKFDNTYAYNKELMREFEEKKEAKRVKKQEKKQQKSQKKLEKIKNNTKKQMTTDDELEMKM